MADKSSKATAALPVRPKEVNYCNGLLFASRFRSLIIHYGVGSHFRPFVEEYTKKNLLPEIHVLALRPKREDQEAALIYKRTRLVLDIVNASVKFYDHNKNCFITCNLDVNRDPRLVTEYSDKQRLLAVLSNFEHPAKCPPLPKSFPPLAVYIDGRVEPLILFHADNSDLNQSMAVIFMLLVSVRRRLEVEIKYQNAFNSTVNVECKEASPI